MQATHRIVLLPCQALPGEQVPRALLSQYQAQAAAAADSAAAAAGADDAPAHGTHAGQRNAAQSALPNYLRRSGDAQLSAAAAA